MLADIMFCLAQIGELPLRVVWWNLRFMVGYRIGGFTHASRGE